MTERVDHFEPCERCGDREGMPVKVGTTSVSLCETCHGAVKETTTARRYGR